MYLLRNKLSLKISVLIALSLNLTYVGFGEWITLQQEIKGKDYSLIAEKEEYLLEYVQTNQPKESIIENFHNILSSGVTSMNITFYGQLDSSFSLPKSAVLYTSTTQMYNPSNTEHISIPSLSITSIYESYPGITIIYTLSHRHKKYKSFPSKQDVEELASLLKKSWNYPKEKAQNAYLEKTTGDTKKKSKEDKKSHTQNSSLNNVPPEAQLSFKLMEQFQQSSPENIQQDTENQKPKKSSRLNTRR